VNTQQQEQLIERAITTLANQRGEKLTLAIGHIVSATPGRKSVAKEEVNHTTDISLITLSHVSVHNSETKGLCVRLVFDSHLYATSGEEADLLVSWAEQVITLRAREVITPFPSIKFQHVDKKVKIIRGEIVTA
jgi:hypothetical protein